MGLWREMENFGGEKRGSRNEKYMGFGSRIFFPANFPSYKPQRCPEPGLPPFFFFHFESPGMPPPMDVPGHTGTHLMVQPKKKRAQFSGVRSVCI